MLIDFVFCKMNFIYFEWMVLKKTKKQKNKKKSKNNEGINLYFKFKNSFFLSFTFTCPMHFYWIFINIL